MKTIRLFALALACLAMMPSCKDEKKQNEESTLQADANNELNDSLATVMAEKDSLMALMNDVADGMMQIKEMQDIVTAQNLNSETPDRKAQLRNDIILIQQSIALKRQRLDELEKKLTQSTNYNAEMQKTIANLKNQLETQEGIISSLKKELAAAHIEISNLNTRVDSLKTVNTTVSREKEAAQQESERLTNELNTCYYAVGSKSELKDNRIIETGFLRKTKIMEGDFEKSYFTKADKRTLNEIQLHSKKAEVMSKHPKEAYTLTDGPSGKVLRILNSTKFWEYSNYLVVKVN